MDNSAESVQELLANQGQLQREEDFIIRTLSKIDKQLHALQVEQLHLLNRMNTGTTTSIPPASTTHTNSKFLPNNENDSIENALKELDLTIPSSILNPEEEVEDEDEDD